MATALMHVLTSHAGTTHLGGTRSTLETSLIWFEREKKLSIKTCTVIQHKNTCISPG